MKKISAFALLIVFGILVIAGCVLLIIIPQTLAEIESQSPSDTNPLSQLLPVIYIALAVACFAAAYGGFYLLVKYKVNEYLSEGLGYSKIVALGSILQIVLCIFFILAWLGGVKGTIVVKSMVIIFLLAPFVIRQVYLKMQPDRKFDNFLLEDDVEKMK